MVRFIHDTLLHLVNSHLFEEPRYASLPNIMKAKKKSVEKLTAAELGIDLTPRLETIRVTEPPKRVGGGKVIDRPFLHSIFMYLQLHTGGKCRRASCQAQRGRRYWQARITVAFMQLHSTCMTVSCH